MRRALLVVLLLVGCAAKEKAATVAGPPLGIAPRDISPSPPVEVAFLDLGPGTTTLEMAPCDRLLVHVVSGRLDVLGDALNAGDTLVVTSTTQVAIRGPGLVVQARGRRANCEPAASRGVIRSGAAERLTWAGGAMSAHLDVAADVSPELYLGRLEGTAPVAEHVHATSWEILCALEAQGTFTLAGKEQRLSGRSIVLVPPNTKHSWRPDPGTKLLGVQLYAPPGPEQRFKILASPPR